MLYVNNEKVSQALIELEYKRLLPHYKRHFKEQSSEEQEKQLRLWSKQNVIEHVLLRQKAKKRKDNISNKEIDKRQDKLIRQSGGMEGFRHNMKVGGTTFQQIRQDIKLQIKIERLLERVGKRAAAISEQEAEEYYTNNQDEFMTPERVHAAHIVKYVKTLQDKEPALKAIEQIKKELSKGQIFEELASQNSDCRDVGGDLGYFTRGQMVQSFEDVVFGMKKGEISDIFLTEFGYHIVKKYDHIQARPRPFEQVKQQIIDKLGQEARQKEVEKYLDRLTTEAVIEEK